MRTKTEKLPPHSTESEQSALGCVLNAALDQPDEAARLAAKLRPSDFYELRHQTIYGAMRCLLLDKRPLTTTNLVQWLKDKGRLKDAGGLGHVAELDAAPAAFDSYVATLREKAARRELLRMATLAAEYAGDESKDAKALAHEFTAMAARIANAGTEPREWINCYTPSECRDYVPPDGHVLVGDCHIVRGMVTVIGGPPGVGKSRGSDSLAVAGATGADWFGLKVHRRFKTLIIQNENGRYRLKKEFSEIHVDGLDEYIRVSEPPAYGMAFDKAEFRAALAQVLEDFKPDVIIFDPWNSVARDDKGKDYLEAFQAIREVLPKGYDAPAVVIVAHTRKPRPDERANGRALLNLLAGSYVLGSVPRCVFVMQPASDDPQDKRVVWTCCKNNDGELGARSAWFRRNGLFDPCGDFGWDEFDYPAKNEGREMVNLEDVEALFGEGGKLKVPRKIAMKELRESTGCGKSAAYNALKADGRFGEHVAEADGLLSWKP